MLLIITLRNSSRPGEFLKYVIAQLLRNLLIFEFADTCVNRVVHIVFFGVYESRLLWLPQVPGPSFTRSPTHHFPINP